MSQAKLEAELLNKDIRYLTETINWMVEQRIDARAISEASDKRVALIRERNRFLAADAALQSDLTPGNKPWPMITFVEPMVLIRVSVKGSQLIERRRLSFDPWGTLTICEFASMAKNTPQTPIQHGK